MTNGFASARSERRSLRASLSFNAVRTGSQLLRLGAGVSLAAMAASLALPAQAADECGDDVGGFALCTPVSGVGNPYPGGITYVGDAGEDITVILQGAPGAVVVNTPGNGVVATSSSGYDATVHAYTGVSIESYGTAIAAQSIGGGMAAVINEGHLSSGSIGIQAVGAGAGSTAVVANYGVIVVDGSDNGRANTAVGIMASTYGDVSIHNEGPITVTTDEDVLAVGIIASSFLEDINVASYGDVTVVNTFGAATGLMGQAQGDVALYSGGDLVVAGDIQTVGIFGFSNTANVVIGDVGDIFAYSYDADTTAIQAYSRGGDAYVYAIGQIYAGAEFYATGVEISAGGDASFAGNGDIRADSASGVAYGIHAEADGDTDIYMIGDVSAEGFGDGIAISVDNRSSGGIIDGLGVTPGGDVEIDVYGDVFGYGLNGIGAGVLVHTGGDIDVHVTGLVEGDSGYGAAYGVAVYSESGYASVEVYDVHVAGVGGTAIYAYGALGAYVTASGTVIAIGADGVQVESDDGNAVASVNNVTTYAYEADAVDAISLTGDAAILAFGDIATFGNDASGLYAFSGSGQAYVYNGGLLETQGFASRGVSASTDTGQALIVNRGQVETHGDYAQGLSAVSLGGGSVLIRNYGEVDTYGFQASGIAAQALNGSGDATVYDNAVVRTSGDGADGILIQASGGAASLFGAGDIYTEGDDAYGVFVAGAQAYAQVGAVVTHGEGSAGIIANSFGYDATDGTIVQTSLVETYGDYSAGIGASSYAGDVQVTATTVETSGQSSQGIVATAQDDLSILFGTVHTYGDAHFNGTSSGEYGLTFYSYGSPSDAIDAYAEQGAVSITGGSVLTTGDGAEGIFADGMGTVSIQVDSVQTTGEALILAVGPEDTYYGSGAMGINAKVRGGSIDIRVGSVETDGYYAIGIRARGFTYYDTGENASYAGDIYIEAGHVLTRGGKADGIQALNYGGDILVTGYGAVTYGDGSNAVEITAWNYLTPDGEGGPEELGAGVIVGGDATVAMSAVRTYGANSAAAVITAYGGDATADIYFATTAGQGSAAVDISARQSLGQAGDVYTDVSYASTLGDYSTGIDAYTEAGDIHIHTLGIYTGGDGSLGIFANANGGDVHIDADSVITAGYGADGILAQALGGDVYVEVGDVRVFGAVGDAINVLAAGEDAEVHMATRGLVTSADGRGIYTQSYSYSLIHIQDDSVVHGHDLGVETNTGGGTYLYLGDGSELSADSGLALDANGGRAVVHNDGLIAGRVDLTAFNDAIINYGDWNAYGTSAFGLGSDLTYNYGTVFFRGSGAAQTTTFTGLESFGNFGVVSGQDNQAGDVLALAGTTFNGGAGSQLALDVQFGGPGSIADRLTIGQATGVTTITPNSVLAATPGALNFSGILVVDSAFASEVGNEFAMAPVKKGFVTYSLKFDAPNDNWLIVGLPNKLAFIPVVIPRLSVDFWGRGADAIDARWTEGRDSDGEAGRGAGPEGLASTRGDGWELWMQAHGGSVGMADNESFDIGGTIFVENLSHNTDWGGFQFGVDDKMGDVILGLTMGFGQQETTFQGGGESFDIEGWNLGAYAEWNRGGFFANGLVSGAFQAIDANLSGVPDMESFDATTWGAKGELGYRMGESGSWFVEPLVSLAWSSADVDSFTASGATIDFGKGDSLIGRAGVRAGWTVQGADAVWTPSLGVFALDEFQGDNKMTFATGPSSFTITDTPPGSYGQATFGLNVQTAGGLDGFVQGEWNFGGDADGGGARVGVRWRW